MNQQNEYESQDHEADDFRDDHQPESEGAEQESAHAEAAEESAESADPVEALTREKDDLYNRLQRVSADYQNYIRRAEQDKVDSLELARADVFRRLVPVLDHFETALGQQVTTDEAKNLATGVRIVRDELMKVLQQLGVERIEPQEGDEFDPHRHEAMLQQAVEGMPAGRVAAVLQPGYQYKERTIRPAKVAVTPA